MPDLEDLLAAEAARYDIRQPPVADIRRRHLRRAQARAGACGLALTVVVIAGVVLGPWDGPWPGREQPVAQDPQPSASAAPAEGPSQTEQDARRDGVPRAVAALSFSDRVDIITREPDQEGVWAISRMPGPPGTLGDTSARYGVDWIQRAEYGELLLLDTTGTRILRALPLPGVPPQAFRIHDDAVYCSREGDGALPDSMICRIDRNGPGRLVRVYDAEGPDRSAPVDLPGWQRQAAPVHGVFSDVVACPEGLCVSGSAGQVPFHPITLAVPYDRATAPDTAAACQRAREAVAAQERVTAPDDPDWTDVEDAMHRAWEAGQGSSDPLFVRTLVERGSVAPGDTQTLGDAVDRLAGLCGLTTTGLRAPVAQRLDRTDEFGAVTSLTRLTDGTLRVQVNRVDWLSGDEAQAAAEADDTEAGDYYVVDDNPRTRAYDISSEAKVYGSIQLTGMPDLSPRPLSDWIKFLDNGSKAMAGQAVDEQVRATYFHFQIQGGLVVGIEEQYRP